MKSIFTSIITLLALTINLSAQEIKPFEDGDKIAFVGNSITEAGFYESNIWLI